MKIIIQGYTAEVIKKLSRRNKDSLFCDLISLSHFEPPPRWDASCCTVRTYCFIIIFTHCGDITFAFAQSSVFWTTRNVILDLPESVIIWRNWLYINRMWSRSSKSL